MASGLFIAADQADGVIITNKIHLAILSGKVDEAIKLVNENEKVDKASLASALRKLNSLQEQAAEIEDPDDYDDTVQIPKLLQIPPELIDKWFDLIKLLIEKLEFSEISQYMAEINKLIEERVDKQEFIDKMKPRKNPITQEIVSSAIVQAPDLKTKNEGFFAEDIDVKLKNFVDSSVVTHFENFQTAQFEQLWDNVISFVGQNLSAADQQNFEIIKAKLPNAKLKAEYSKIALNFAIEQGKSLALKAILCVMAAVLLSRDAAKFLPAQESKLTKSASEADLDANEKILSGLAEARKKLNDNQFIAITSDRAQFVEVLSSTVRNVQLQQKKSLLRYKA